MDCLLRLVHDTKTLASSWEREPILTRDLDSFDDILSLESVDAMLARGFPLASVRLTANGAQLPSLAVAAPGRYGRSAGARVTDAAKVARRVRDGATLILEDLKERVPAISVFANALSGATGYDSYSSAFLTPARHPGVTAHHDTASVFVRQLSGTKHWRVSRPAHPWPIRENGPGARPPRTEEVLSVTLRPGDCLYLPRGFVHAAEAGERASLHVSFALRPVTWALLLQRALERAADEEEALREALPPAFADADRADLLRERADVFAAHVARLAADGRAAGLVRAQTPAPQAPGLLLDALRVPGKEPV
jgi:hypothetical protein